MTRDKDIGKILRSRRLELGMTQEQVALKLGMSIHQYQRYEYGEHRFPGQQRRIKQQNPLSDIIRERIFFFVKT